MKYLHGSRDYRFSVGCAWCFWLCNSNSVCACIFDVVISFMLLASAVSTACMMVFVLHL